VDASKERWRIILLRTVVAVLLVLAAFAIAILLYRRHPQNVLPQQASPRSLAILPLQNLRQAPDDDFLGFSLADAIITKLDYVNSLTIRPSTAVEKFRKQEIDIQKVASELNVDTLLTGSYIHDRDNLRITYQLIDVKTDKLLFCLMRCFHKRSRQLRVPERTRCRRPTGRPPNLIRYCLLPSSGLLTRLDLCPSRPLCSGDLPPCCRRERAFGTYRNKLLRRPHLCPTRSLCSSDPRTSRLGQFSGGRRLSVCLAESCERSTDSAEFLSQAILLFLQQTDYSR